MKLKGMRRLGLKSLMALAGAILLAAPAIAEACAMCGLPPGDHATFAFHTSVIFMMLSPYAVFAVLSTIVYLSWRNAMKKRRAAGDDAGVRQ